jgi:crotonobetainyl-CoA:carnitine CoA-transferase CaiB-like acyl-CoA transferase
VSPRPATLDGLTTQLGLDAAGLAFVGPPEDSVLASRLAVGECASAAVSTCLLAGAELARARTGQAHEIELDRAHVEAAVRSETWLRDPTGQSMPRFSSLSRFWTTRDGWVRTQANYPWHRAALLDAFGLPAQLSDAEAADRLTAETARRASRSIENVVYGNGGLAVATRTRSEWSASTPGEVVSHGPLIDIRPIGTAGPLPEYGGLPASGVRVLDLTRVIAGPVGTRMLAALGADVLRVDDPRRPELAAQRIEGVVGKRSARVDLRSHEGVALIHRLLQDADVCVTGYRPDALRRFGLEPDQIVEAHPGLIVASLSAWGAVGPWGRRRGFDSLVQAATGIAMSAGDGTAPDALPCQLLDHATGYLLAASVLVALTSRHSAGEASSVRLSLARTAGWVLDEGQRPFTPGPSAADDDATEYLADLSNGWRAITPPGSINGQPLAWPNRPPRYGASAAVWLPRS